MPSVSLQAQSSHSQGQGSFGPLTGFGGVYTNSNSITGQLTVPIYQAGTEYASIRSALESPLIDDGLNADIGLAKIVDLAYRRQDR